MTLLDILQIVFVCIVVFAGLGLIIKTAFYDKRDR
ncbi:cellulose biosynthesis protein BcsF [uncultured Campylobacter sp.]